MQLTLVRHGQSTANALGILQGHSDYPLSEQGRQEARALGKKLKQEKKVFDQIYSSDLLRAAETAKLITQELGMFEDSIVLTDLLREHNLGVFEGKVYNDLSIKEKKYLEDTWNTPNRKIPDGESVNEYIARLGLFLTEIEQISPPLRSILVITHGGSIYHLLKNHMKILPRMEDWFNNCSVNIVEKIDSYKWKLILLNG